jgi:hypothetical protein
MPEPFVSVSSAAASAGPLLPSASLAPILSISPGRSRWAESTVNHPKRERKPAFLLQIYKNAVLHAVVGQDTVVRGHGPRTGVGPAAPTGERSR